VAGKGLGKGSWGWAWVAGNDWERTLGWCLGGGEMTGKGELGWCLGGIQDGVGVPLSREAEERQGEGGEKRTGKRALGWAWVATRMGCEVPSPAKRERARVRDPQRSISSLDLVLTY
jgi:hypothetical protein